MNALKRKEWLKHLGTSNAFRRFSDDAYDYELENLVKDFMLRFATKLSANSIVVDLDCAARSHWEYLSELDLKILGASDKQHENEGFSFDDCRILRASPDEFNFVNAFDGILSLRFFEGVFPEYWSRTLRKLHLSLKPGGVVFLLNAVSEEGPAYENFRDLRSRGLPVVVGEFSNEQSNIYSFRPLADWARHWIAGAGFFVVQETEKKEFLFSLVKR